MSLGNWSFAFEDFDREDLLHQLDNPEWQALQKIIDPFNYRLKLENTPKYSITCSGDPFFLERLFLHVDNSDVVTNIDVTNIQQSRYGPPPEIQRRIFWCNKYFFFRNFTGNEPKIDRK